MSPEHPDRKGGEGARPILQALILADHVYVEGHTGKKIIAGTFNRLNSSEFPAVFPQWTQAFLSLRGCRGRVIVQLRYRDLDDYSVLAESPRIEIDSSDPLRGQDVVIGIPPLPMPHPGCFALEAHCNDEMVGDVRIEVLKTPQTRGAEQ